MSISMGGLKQERFGLTFLCVNTFFFQVIRTAALTHWATSLDISPRGHLMLTGTSGKENSQLINT